MIDALKKVGRLDIAQDVKNMTKMQLKIVKVDEKLSMKGISKIKTASSETSDSIVSKSKVQNKTDSIPSRFKQKYCKKYLKRSQKSKY